jgi:hypothetical protein
VQPSGRAFEGVRTPRSVLQINIEDVRTSEQHRPDARSINILQEVYFLEVDTVWEVSAIRPDDSASRPDNVLYLQTVQTTQQYVRTISSSSDTSRIMSVHGKVLANTVRTLGQVVRTQT